MIKKMEIQNIEIDNSISKSQYLKGSMIYLTALISTPILLVYYFYFKEINTEMFFILSMVIVSILSLDIDFSKEKEYEVDGVVSNNKLNNYFLNMGYFVKEHSKQGASKDFTKKNIIAPINVDETLFRTHMNIIGTTGSGKTVFAKNMMRQLIRDIGTGFIFIEGKGDAKMALEIYAEIVMAKREHDFFILNFLDKENSNTINPLELGDYDSLRDLLLDFIAGDGDNSDTWLQGGKELLQGVLKPLIYLRDANLVWNPKFSKEINSIEDIEKYRDTASIPVLKDIVNTPTEIFEFAMAISRLYKNDKLNFKKRLKTYTIKDDEEIDLETTSIEIHEGLIDVMLRQTQEIPSWEYVMSKGSYESLEKDMESASDSLYKINISCSFYGEMFSLFLETFGEIFGVKEGDINLEDIIVNGKILHVVLQGINPSLANSLGKLLLALIRMVAKKRAKKNPLRFPYAVFLDEFNSWSKGIDGFADLMSVTRAYGLSFVVMYQTDLKKIDDGKSIEAGQIMGNTNITYLLKVNDDDIGKRIIEALPKKKVLRKSIKIKNGMRNESDVSEDNYSEYEEDAITLQDLRNLQSGQGFMFVNGQIHKCISAYIPDNTMFSISPEDDIPINKLLKKDSSI